MKNKFITIIALMVALLIPSLVNAANTAVNLNSSNNVTRNLTVGNVATNGNTNTNTNTNTPIYNVDIEWDGFVFDWVYNNSNGQYEWANGLTSTCEPVKIDAGTTIYSGSGYYRNSACTTELAGVISTATDAYMKRASGHEVTIYDHSQDGYVVPSLSWSPTTNYQFTKATYEYEANKCERLTTTQINSVISSSQGYYMWTNSNCSGTPTYVTTGNYVSSNSYYGNMGGSTYKVYSGGMMPDIARIALAGDYGYGVFSEGSRYSFRVRLGVSRAQTVRTPVQGETIGSLRITFTTHRN